MDHQRIIIFLNQGIRKIFIFIFRTADGVEQKNNKILLKIVILEATHNVEVLIGIKVNTIILMEFFHLVDKIIFTIGKKLFLNIVMVRVIKDIEKILLNIKIQKFILEVII